MAYRSGIAYGVGLAAEDCRWMCVGESQVYCFRGAAFLCLAISYF